MKKILILAATALIATAGSAFAKGTTTISLDNFCDVLTIKGNKILKTALTWRSKARIVRPSTVPASSAR